MKATWCCVGCVTAVLAACGAGGASPLPPASAEKLPVWRGFNLLEKFHLDWTNRPFLEEDFALISELGFNFVRLPMDYRTWIVDGDWRQFNEKTLEEIDQAVAWGGQYGIHVSINFHRAPGYTVAQPAEPTSLWTDEETQEVCALHWATFARRYRGIPNERLSFNLMNEPGDIDGAVYALVVRKLVDAIRAEDPDRLVICDGLAWGRNPCMELAPLGVAQATRGYEPMGLTHYLASWVYEDQAMPLPSWPMPEASGYLYGPYKKELQAPLVLTGDIAGTLRLRVGVVSSLSALQVTADGDTVWTKRFECGPGEGEWRKAEYMEEWDSYQNTYDRDYTVEIPPGTRRVEILNTEGDWLTLVEIGMQAGDAPETVLGLSQDWGKTVAPIRLELDENTSRFATEVMQDRAWLRERAALWKEWKGGVMVGEWGSFNKTPHDVTLRWMEDCLRNWKEVGWGWALWNFRGEFGILNSGREDVDYEDWRGHKLDRKMLDLLQRY